MSNYRRYFRANDAVFVTLVTGNRRPWLHEADQKQMMLSVMAETKKRYAIRNIAHVVLDDHIHWMFDALAASVPKLISAIKQGAISDRKQNRMAWQGLWQSRYYDHIIRDERDFQAHLDYIHFNPVRHRYVRNACDYPWSSFRQWVCRGVYQADWGVSHESPVQAMDLE